jgi:hypothetical protein
VNAISILITLPYSSSPLSHTESTAPSKIPTSSPSKAPSATPTTKHPTMTPSISQVPTVIVYTTFTLPDFELTLTHTGTAETNLVYGGITQILQGYFTKNSTYYTDLELTLEPGIETYDDSGIVSSPFTFALSLRFSTDKLNLIPPENELALMVMRAFLQDDVGLILNGATSNEFQSFSLMNTGTSQLVTGNAATEIRTDDSTSSQSALNLTIGISGVAIVSTVAALLLLIVQRRKIAGEEENANSPTKPAEDKNLKALSKMRSPFSMTSPVDGTRKYFNKLDDESVSLKGPQSPYLNPNISVVNSSFSRDEESSLEAPSMTGLSSICEISKIDADSVRSLDGLESAHMDGESCADMSALDEVRLGRVLNLDESTVGENSLNTRSESGSKIERQSAFQKLWYGSRKKKEKASPVASPSPLKSKLAPPLNDSPTKKLNFPEKLPEEESLVHEEKSIVSGDENSLLGNQSDKGSYYDKTESRSLFYSMLGDRSINSLESGSVDFNDMYAADSSSYDEYSSMGASSVIANVAGGSNEDEEDC